MKLSFFNIKEFLSVGMLSVLSLIATVIVFAVLHPLQEAHALMTVVTLVFAGIYVRLLFARKAELDRFELIKGGNYRLMVRYSTYDVSPEDIKAEFDSTVQAYSEVFGTDRVQDAVEKAKTFWLIFEEMPLKIYGKNISGGTTYYTTNMTVGYVKGQDIKTTAFKHELGHIIQAGVSGVWDEAEHHKISKENNLP